MPKQLLHEYISQSEMTPELLASTVDSIAPHFEAIFAFVELATHTTERIELNVIVDQLDQSANIVGFSDSSIFTKGRKIETRLEEPFHVKNIYPMKATDRDGFIIRNAAGQYMIDEAARAYAISDLETKRRNLQRWAIMAMLNEKAFVYNNGLLRLTVPYGDVIKDLTPSATKWDDTSFDLLDEMQRVKAEFYKTSGMIPTVAMMNPAMGRVLLRNPDVRAAFTAAQSSDPDRTAGTFSSFLYNGIEWHIFHEQYPDVRGDLKSPVADGRIIFGVKSVGGVVAGSGIQAVNTTALEAGKPIKLNRTENILNNYNADRPYYDSLELEKDPYAAGVRLYDNMLPSVEKKGAFQHLNNCLT